MKKTAIILAALFGVFTLFSCGNVTFSQIQTQVANMFTLESTVAVIVGGVLKKHPESVDLFKKISSDILVLTDKDVLTLDDVEQDLIKRVNDSNLPCKAEIVLTINKIIDKISGDPKFDIAAHKDELLDLSQGIDWAIEIHEYELAKEQKDVPESDETK